MTPASYNALLRELHSADAALATVHDAVIQTGLDGEIVRMNSAAERMTGMPLNKLLGQPLGDALSLADAPDEDRTVRRGQPMPQGVYQVLRQRGGGERLVLVSMADHEHGCTYVLRDAANDRQPRSGHDSLTGLPDRQFLEQRLSEILAGVNAPRHQLLYLDLDQFKVVNDLCGHRAGDLLLQQLTGRWQASMEAGEMLARLGGDEFCAVLARADMAAACQVAESLINEAQQLRFEWQGQTFRIGASGGLVGFDSGKSADQLLAAADSACWAAKDNGRNRLQVFNALDGELQSRQLQMSWVSRIARAIDENRMTLYYQRIEALGDGEAHAEILVRLIDEDGTMVPPDQFIPAAERFNLMPRIDRWVIERVCAGIAAHGSTGLGDIASWAINLSGTTFNDPRFTDWVRNQIVDAGIPPGTIGFELTETAAIADLARATEFIAAMQELGCAISLDDFGSGVSSFAYLKTLQVDYLKIDGAFVRNAARDHIDSAMVEAIHRVGSVMGIPTIAEFVEDEQTAEAMRALGINYAQGFGLHRPEPWPWVAD